MCKLAIIFSHSSIKKKPTSRLQFKEGILSLSSQQRKKKSGSPSWPYESTRSQALLHHFTPLHHLTTTSTTLHFTHKCTYKFCLSPSFIPSLHTTTPPLHIHHFSIIMPTSSSHHLITHTYTPWLSTYTYTHSFTHTYTHPYTHSYTHSFIQTHPFTNLQN